MAGSSEESGTVFGDNVRKVMGVGLCRALSLRDYSKSPKSSVKMFFTIILKVI